MEEKKENGKKMDNEELPKSVEETEVDDNVATAEEMEAFIATAVSGRRTSAKRDMVRMRLMCLGNIWHLRIR